jgi:fluoroquinolone resistance protein
MKGINIPTMQDIYIVDQTFEKAAGTQQLKKGDYENCCFNGIDFSEYNLSGFSFIDCVFNDCNLSVVKIEKTSFQDVKFNNCKMLGLRLDRASAFGLSLSFENCALNHSVCMNVQLKKTAFQNCQLQEVDFTGADCSQAVFYQCDLSGATFDGTNLEKADFRTAVNYSLDLSINKVKKAKFSVEGLPGLLEKYDIEIK